MGMVVRLAFWVISLGALMSVALGSAALTVTEKIVELVWRLVMVGVVDQWVVVPLLRALGKVGELLLARWRRRDRG